MRTARCQACIAIALITLVVLVPGCSTVHVSALQSSNAGDIYERTEIAWLWGFSEPEQKVDCSGSGLHVVAVKTNWLYSLCTVVTLGAVAPVTVQYQCAAPCMTGGGPIGEVKP